MGAIADVGSTPSRPPPGPPQQGVPQAGTPQPAAVPLWSAEACFRFLAVLDNELPLGLTRAQSRPSPRRAGGPPRRRGSTPAGRVTGGPASLPAGEKAEAGFRTPKRWADQRRPPARQIAYNLNRTRP